MTKFKSGDKVERTWVVGDSTTQLTGIERWGIYTVDIVCGDCISLVESFQPGFAFSSERFELAEEQDDPLPPAPGSVRYNDEYPNRSAYKQTWLDVKQDDNRVYIETGQYGESNGVGMVLSADAALQLAHDLTRMAMEIKRKEKQQQRKTTLSPAIVHPYGE